MRIKIILLAITILSLTSSVFAATEKKINLALIADNTSGLEKSPIISLLEVELSKLENVNLLERNEIEKILAEKKLQLSFEVTENESRKQIGTILGADALLFVKLIRNQEQKESINTRFVETRTGIIFDNLLQNSSNIDEDIQGLIKEIKQRILKVNVPLDQRHYLGISDIRNEEPGRELNPIALALTQLLKYDLNSSKNIVILEREQLNHIIKERDLGGIDVQLRASTILLEGGIRRNGNAKEYSVSMKFIEPSSGKSKNVALTVPSSDITITRQEICKAVISELGDTSEFNISGDSHMEAAYFLKRTESYCTDLLLELTDNRDMLISFAETALALDENNIDLRNTVFHCILNIAWDNKTFSEIDHLKIEKRAHEIDLGTVERYARLGTQHIPDLTFDYLFQLYSYNDTSSVKSNEKEKLELQSEIHDICVKKYNILYKLFQTENKSPILLLTKRTRDSYGMYDTPDEFSQNLKSFVLENEKYQSKKSITFYEILADSLGCYRERNKEILPLLEWLRNRPDPTLKMLSYYALVHPEIDNDEAAIKVCDLLFFNDAQNVGEAIWKAAIKLSILGKLESYFENVLILAENNKNFNILNNPELILEFIGRARKEKQIDWCRRIQPILDTYIIPSAQLNKFQRLQAALDRFLIKEYESDKNNIGRWANYAITPISITNHDIIKDRYPEWVHIDNLNKKIAVVWRSLPQGNSLFNYIVTTMDIKGDSLKQILKIESKNGLSIKCSENSSDCIFLGTPDKGLIMIGPDGFEIFGEAQGCPSNNILSMAYLNNYLYLGFYGSFAKFDPQTKTFEILASYKAIQTKNDLDGGNLYWIGSMIADTKNDSIWFTLFADLKRHGIWKYNPITGKFILLHHPYGNRLFFNDNGDIVFTIQSQINLLNPQTSEIKLLQGYSWEVVGGLSGFEIGTHCVMIGKDIIQPTGKLFSDDGKIYNLGKSWLQIEPFGSGAVAVSYYETNLNLSLIQPKELITNNNEE